MANLVNARVALIGVGDISDWHVRAMRLAGVAVTAVSSRAGSARLKAFSERHQIPQVYPNWRAMLHDADSWDGFVIATHVDGTPEILREALQLRKPILVEKPIAHDVNQLATLVPLAHARVLVGYNRRYYRTTQRAKAFVTGGDPVLALLTIPESITSPVRPDGRSYLFPFFENSSHALDLVRFLFGSVEPKAVQPVRFRSGELAGFAAILESRRGDVIQVLGNWGTPSNFALSLNRPGDQFELRPFELGTVYKGMDVIPPSEEFPIRRYVPRVAERIMLDDIDMREKPGFVAQANEFAVLMDGEEPQIGATLAEALEVMRLCRQLVAST